MIKGNIDELEKDISDCIHYREEMINGRIGKIRGFILNENGSGIYREIAEMSHHAELLVKELRDLLTGFHDELQASGLTPGCKICPQLPGIDINIEEKCIRITMDGIMPYPLKGSVYYLHNKLDAVLERFVTEKALPRPFFTQRCAVVFLHHYGGSKKQLRHLRDYDNVEHRCITNVLAAHLMWGDSPRCMICLDVLASGDSNYTEIRVMPLPDFRAFVMSENIDFTL